MDKGFSAQNNPDTMKPNPHEQGLTTSADNMQSQGPGKSKSPDQVSNTKIKTPEKQVPVIDLKGL